jgi:hypothetical protein
MLRKYLESKKLDKKIPEITNTLIKNIIEDSSLHHIKKYPIPSKTEIFNILKNIIDLIFPGYFTEKEINFINMTSHISILVNDIFENYPLKFLRVLNIIIRKIVNLRTCNECVEKGLIHQSIF